MNPAAMRIRNINVEYEQIEAYITAHSEALFIHGLCPGCAVKLYPEYFKNIGPSKGGP